MNGTQIYYVRRLTSMMPGAGTGTNASFFIVALEYPLSSNLTSLALIKIFKQFFLNNNRLRNSPLHTRLQYSHRRRFQRQIRIRIWSVVKLHRLVFTI